MSEKKPGITYADSGVSIDAGNALVRLIAPLAKATRRSGSTPALGGFGAIFDPKAAGYKDPLLVACNDGVGTKVKIAIESGLHDHIGIDLVAMCVNDLIVQGAEPLFFLDYFATGKLELEIAERVIASIASGCMESNCALIGGETAEMPGLYAEGDYDLAGFCVGAVERDEVLDHQAISEGDILLGLASSGVHSNGYSLVRRLVSNAGLGWHDPAPFDQGQSLAQALLTPTRIYVAPLLPLIRKGFIHGLAHITGGGLLENIPRILPENLRGEIDCSCWPLPPVFIWLAQQSGLSLKEMMRTFNCGIGMVAIVPREHVEAVQAHLTAQKCKALNIGSIVSGSCGLTVKPSSHQSWGLDSNERIEWDHSNA